MSITRLLFVLKIIKFWKSHKYLIINVNYSYVDNQFKNNRPLVPLDLNFMLGSYAFSLQATIDHHGLSMYNGYHTAPVYCCKKTFYCNDVKITVSGINHALSSTKYIMIYKLCVEWVYNQNTEDGKYFLPWCQYTVHLNKNRLRNWHWNLLGGQCVSSWWPLI